MKPARESTKRNSIQQFTHFLILFWIAALIIFIGFNLFVHQLQTEEIEIGNRILIANLFVLMLVSLLLIFPMFRKIHDQFAKLTQINKELEEKTNQLERFRTADLNMIQDVQQEKR